MTLKTLVLFACCWPLSACNPERATKMGISTPTNGATVILDVAMYGGAQLPAAIPQSGWLALCPSDAGTVLRATTVTLVPYFDDIANDAPGQQTGREVKATNCEAPLLLVADPALGVRPVRDAKLSGQQIVMDDLSEQIAPTPGNQVDVPARLILRGKQGSRILLESTYSTSIEYKIRWAGDLDEDGSLDLVVEENQEATFLHLFLSRIKPLNGHWKPAATTYYGGC